MPESKRDSKRGQGKGTTPKAGATHNDWEIELSILQTAYEQAILHGMKAKSSQQATGDGTPVIIIQILNANICQKCQAWNVGTECATCPTE